MDIYLKRAEELVIEVIKNLQKTISNDGENISYYTHGILDDPIKKLIDAKVMMGMSQICLSKG